MQISKNFGISSERRIVRFTNLKMSYGKNFTIESDEKVTSKDVNDIVSTAIKVLQAKDIEKKGKEIANRILKLRIPSIYSVRVDGGEKGIDWKITLSGNSNAFKAEM